MPGREGLSRGAQVHHFPTKQDLVLAAIEHLLERRQEEFRSIFESLEPAGRTLAAALDLLWSIYRADTFAAWLELAVAARTDDELRPPFLEMERRFAENVAETFVSFFPTSPDPRFTELAVEFAFSVLEGLALKRHLGIEADADELLEMLKFLATMFASDMGGTT
jgi:AcrR family transcriptional regulator